MPNFKSRSRNTAIKLFSTIVILITFSACSLKSDEQKALDYLKENRALRSGYDGKDSLTTTFLKLFKEKSKYKQGEKVNTYNNTDLFAYNSSLFTTLLDSLQKLNFTPAATVPDVTVVTDSFLVEQRDWAIQTWRSPWCNHLSYDEFCSFILPYRTADEPFEEWRKILSKKYPWLLKFDKEKTTALEALCQINDSCRLYMPFFIKFDKLRMLSVSEMGEAGRGSCVYRTVFAMYMMRTAGLPVGFAFNREGHTWNLFIDKDGKWYSFGGSESNPRTDRQNLAISIKRSKIFLKTFHPSEHETLLLKEKYINNIPQNFLKLFCEDITSKVIPTTSLDIPIAYKEKLDNGSPIFLCVGNSRKERWFPLDYTLKRDKKVVHISDVGHNALYILATYTNNEFGAISNPFYVDSIGNVNHFIPDSTAENSITLFRKTDLNNDGYFYSFSLIGDEIIASNDVNFKKFELLHTIDTLYESFKGKNFATENAFRYYRFCGKIKGANISEFAIYDKQNNNILNNVRSNDTSTVEVKKIIDNKHGTYLTIKENSFFTFDAGKKVTPVSFKILARNDLNVLENGEPYQLFQWLNGDWALVGEKIANNECVSFSKLSSNAIFYLAHKSKGRESTLFWVENNRVRWTIQNDFDKRYIFKGATDLKSNIKK